MSRSIIKVWIPNESYHHLKEMASAYQVSMSSLAGSMIEENLSGKQSFEEIADIRFSDLSKRLGKMAYRLSRSELLLDEFLFAYLFYTPEVPRDFPGRAALLQSADNRHKAILSRIQERLKRKEEAVLEMEPNNKNKEDGE
jgi:hypothetical protein